MLALTAVIASLPVSAQTEKDTAGGTISDSSAVDTLSAEHAKLTDDAPLDIARDRGIFITTPDQRLQMRILGSIRMLVVYDNEDLSSKNTLDTYQIPIGNPNRQPNYFNGLDQTRLGFEVTRKTSKSPVFARLEADFAGQYGFRIRHAYGQYERFLMGQTWSLFSQITALPPTVDNNATGTVDVRTPQIRYSLPRKVLGMNVAVGLEYLTPTVSVPDTVSVNEFALLPDFTVRLNQDFSWGKFQISGILPVFTGEDSNGELLEKTGWGVSAGLVTKAWSKSKWYLSGVCGEGITSFVSDLTKTGSDVIVESGDTVVSPFTYGGYVALEQKWNGTLSSNIGGGLVHVEKLSFTADDEFARGFSTRINTFWGFVEGAKLGGEIAWGQREDKGGDKGNAFRFSLLSYYDF